MRWLHHNTLDYGRWSYLSRVPARMYLPLGENLTNETGGFSSSEGGRSEEGQSQGSMQHPMHATHHDIHCTMYEV